jgi:hypothetical protein
MQAVLLRLGSKWPVLQRCLVLTIALVIAAMAGYEIKHTPPEYLESASVVFRLPPSLASNKAETLDNAVRYPALITAGYVMAQSLMSPEYEHLVRDAGGTAAFDLAMVNASDEEYPAYPYPLATLTAQSANPVVVHRTFALAARVLSQLVLRRQILAAVPARSRMWISLVGDTGPVSQRGSLKRALIALALLAIIAISKISGWLKYSQRRLAVLPVPGQRRAEPATIRGPRRSARSHTEPGRVKAGRRPAQHRAPRKR